MAVEVGSAYVSIIPSFRGFGSAIQSNIAKEASVMGRRAGDDFGAAATRSMGRSGASAGKAFASGVQSAVSGLGKFTALSVFASNAAVAAAGAAKFAAALAPAAGALGLLPAAGLAGAAAVGTLKVAFAGLGDAISEGLSGDTEKFNKAIEGMGAGAQETARAVVGLRPALVGLRADVQNAVFSGVGPALTRLADTYLPMVRSTLVATGAEFNAAFRQTAALATSRQFIADMNTALVNVKASFSGLGGVVAPLLSAIRDIGVVGSTFLPGLTSGAAGAAQSFAGLVSQMRESGQLQQIMSAGLSTLGELGKLAGDVAGTVSGVFRAMGAGGDGALGPLRQLASTLNEAVNSAGGQAGLSSVFAAISAAGAALGPVLGAVGGALVPLGQIMGSLATAAGPGLTAVVTAVGQALAVLAPHASTVGKAMADVLVAVSPLLPIVAQLAATVLSVLAPAISSVARLLGENRGVVIGVAAALGALLVVTKLHTAFLAVQAVGGLSAYVAQMGIVQAATKVWAAVQWVLNAALTANPIGIIVVAVAALVAGLIYAYRNSETFRNIVQGALNGIAAAGKWMWENALKPAFDGIVAAVRWVGDAAMWLWNTAIKPAFDGIMFAARLLAVVIGTVVVVPMMLAWKALSAAFTWAYDTVFRPVFQGIAAVAMWLWNNVLQPTWAGLRLAWSALVMGISWAWDNVLRPAWAALGAYAQWLWTSVLRPVWEGIKAGWQVLTAGIAWAWDNVVKPAWNALGAAARWLWDSVLRPVWGGIKAGWDGLMSGLKWAWENVLRPVFDAISNAVGRVRDSFGAAVEGIRGIWNRLREVAAVPVNFVIREVYNEGIRQVWNWIADKVGGVGKLDAIEPIRFATGGVAPGRGNRDSVLSLLTPGEGVLDRQDMAALGGPRGFEAFRSRLKAGQGGVWDDAMAAAAGFTSAVRGGLAGFAEKMLRPIRNLLGRIPFGDTGLGGLIKAAPPRLMDRVLEWVRGDDRDNAAKATALMGDASVGGWAAMWSAVHSQFPFTNLASGHRPGDWGYHGLGRAVDITVPEGFGGPRWWQVFNWIKGTYGKNIQELIWDFAGGGAVWQGREHFFTGPTAGPGTHADHIHFAMDNGGLLEQGTHLVTHRPSEPDRVLTGRQWRVAEQAMFGGRREPPQVNVYPRADQSETEIAAGVSREFAWAVR